jgi:hypothetical protein
MAERFPWEPDTVTFHLGTFQERPGEKGRTLTESCAEIQANVNEAIANGSQSAVTIPTADQLATHQFWRETWRSTEALCELMKVVVAHPIWDSQMVAERGLKRPERSLEKFDLRPAIRAFGLDPEAYLSPYEVWPAILTAAHKDRKSESKTSASKPGSLARLIIEAIIANGVHCKPADMTRWLVAQNIIRNHGSIKNELRRMVARGELRRVGHGIYSLPEAKTTR